MSNEKVTLPSSGGGLVRYDENSSSKIQIDPKTVIVIIAIVILGMILLTTFGGALVLSDVFGG